VYDTSFITRRCTARLLCLVRTFVVTPVWKDAGAGLRCRRLDGRSRGAGIGRFFGGTVGSYLRGCWTKKGEHLATYQDNESLLAQEGARAYEQEKVKRLATREDIENVLRELHAVTQTTETIKAEIGTAVWLRQTVWRQKREVHATILKKIHHLHDRLNAYRSTRFVALHDEQRGLPEQHVINLQGMRCINKMPTA
jgi:hypothetical protein